MVMHLQVLLLVLSDHSVNAVNALGEEPTNEDREALSLWVAVVPSR